LLKCLPLKVSAGVQAGIWTHFSRDFSEVSYTRIAARAEALVVYERQSDGRVSRRIYTRICLEKKFLPQKKY